MKKERIFLTGFMGAGKTSVGKILARKLQYPFIDVDEEIEKNAGTTISRIFEEKGEAAFRLLEEKTLERLVATTSQAVIATGGGIILSPTNRKLMRQEGVWVFLDASLEIIKQRIGHTTHRPLLKSPNLAKIYKERMPYYRQSEIIINTESFHDASATADYIENVLREKMKSMNNAL